MVAIAYNPQLAASSSAGDELRQGAVMMMPTLRDILTPSGEPRVNVPFTKGGRTYAVVGLSITAGGWVYSVRLLDARPDEWPVIEVSEKKFFAGVR
jgi:hypothetical protein